MTFGEKLYQLRKEKGLSQEALAEKLNTSRQAISKWENGQGYPETEKLLMIGNIFEVSMDYLLKDTTQQSGNENKEGYYVSKEMAEGYLMSTAKFAKPLAFGVSLLILSTVPYFIFRGKPEVYAFLIIILAALGIMTIVAGLTKMDSRYQELEKKALIFDQNYLKELKKRYESFKKRYSVVAAFGIGLIVISGLAFLLERKDITLGVLVPYYPVFIVLIAIGAFVLIRIFMIIVAYDHLVNNEEHRKEEERKANKKWRKLKNEWF